MPAGASFGLHAALLIRARPAARIATGTRCGRVSPGARPAPWLRVQQQQQMRPNSSFGPRVGKAVEPTAEWDGNAEQQNKEGDEAVKAVEEKGKRPEPQTKSVVKLDPNQDQEPPPPPPPPPRDHEPQKHELDPRSQSDNAEPSKDTSQQGTTDPSTSPDQGTRQVKDDGAAAATTPSGGPLEAVLHMEPPQKVARQHPAMSPPPYVHHFDSYSLVKQLQDGGYSPDQAIEAMKGIRALLAQNLDVAQESLVSKSDVENETYLFRAACSELGQEIKNNRRLQDEQVRQQRTLLQHEVDILTQSLNQEVLSLNDNVRGMFNDRRMAVREEQKNADSAVQQINYKISTSLVSDSKSEIEGVRWVLIRRSALGIFFMAMLTLATVRYATYVSKERQREVARERELEERVKRDGGKRDNSSAADAAVILAAN